MNIFLDFETRSRVALKTHGISRYASDPSTEVLCMAWAVEQEEVQIWRMGEPFPDELATHLAEKCLVHAHNCQFERYIWASCKERLGWPNIDFEQWRCTAAKAAYANRPRSLDQCAKALLKEVDHKDATGHKLMLKMCKPDRKGEWVEDWDSMRSLEDYCKQDVVTERALDAVLPNWPESEVYIWQCNERVNDRGVPIDIEFCLGATAMLTHTLTQIAGKLSDMTNGEITTGNQVQRIKKFVHERGVNIESLNQEHVAAALKTELPEEVRDILVFRQLASGSAAKKYRSALDVSDSDGRARCLTLYYGASQTGRFAGMKTQFQNMKKGSDPTDMFRNVVVAHDPGLAEMIYGDQMVTELGKNVRAMVHAEDGNTLLRCDSSQIECRVLHWLAGNKPMLDTFRNDEDPYIKLAEEAFNKKVGKKDEERQVGKAAVLGLGFGMGAARFVEQVKTMAGISLTKRFAQRIVELYRTNNSSVTRLWSNLEKAAQETVRTGSAVRVGHVCLKADAKNLRVQLPSGRHLFYPDARFEGEGRNLRFCYTSPRSPRAEWAGGLLTENIVQAVARDTLVSYLCSAKASGLDVIFHVHDELIIECPLEKAEVYGQRLLACFDAAPAWAKGLPFAAELTVGPKYA